MADRYEHYARTIRDFLLGRLSRDRTTEKIPTSTSPSMTPRILRWWIFEGAYFSYLGGPICGSWRLIHQQTQSLLRIMSPKWRIQTQPTGEVDWLKSAEAQAISTEEVYVTRSSSIGLLPEEAEALKGWLQWLQLEWGIYTASVGKPNDQTMDPPWPYDATQSGNFDSFTLRRWAHVARRSRWPLLRQVVATSLRYTFEEFDIDQLVLPTKSDVIFELYVLVRFLIELEPRSQDIRWLDHERERNVVSMKGLRAHYQHSFQMEAILGALFPDPARRAIQAHQVGVPKIADLIMTFDPPRQGIRGILCEVKSGSCDLKDTVYQLLCYKEGLNRIAPGTWVVWGIVEKSQDVLADVPLHSTSGDDIWLFSDAEAIPKYLQHLGFGRGMV